MTNLRREAEERKAGLLLLPGLRLLRLLRLSLLRHCCPPSHGMWRCRNSEHRGSTFTASGFTPEREKKHRLRLTSSVRERRQRLIPSMRYCAMHIARDADRQIIHRVRQK